MTEALSQLVELLDLEAIEVNVFRGRNLDETRLRVFGGQVAAQSLVAAGRTVESGRVHSLHSYFLRPGDPTAPILYEVDRIRDGRSFTTRRVVAIQHGRAIFNLQCSFHIDEGPGFVHQAEMPEVPRADDLPTVRERLEPHLDQLPDWFVVGRPRPIDQRYIGDLPWLPTTSRETRQRLWVRADGELADDPLLHAAVIAYASDMSIIDSVLKPHEVRWRQDKTMVVSLDHCMWFHRPFRADRWLLVDQDSPNAYGARGLARGLIFDEEGRLVVSLVQEGLLRVTPQDLPPKKDPGERT
ncbi:MAG: acyl-CoA thioesterase II [Acidimicrobiales bacterium]